MPQTVSGFIRKAATCDYDRISAVYQEASELILDMLELRTFDQLKFQQAKVLFFVFHERYSLLLHLINPQLSFLLNQNVVLGCQDRLFQLTHEKQQEIAFADQKQCSRNEVRL